MRFAPHPFSEIYIVSDKQEIHPEASYNLAEQELGVELPTIYKKYVTTFGRGLYCDFIRLFAPSDLIKRKDMYSRPWDGRSKVISSEEANTAIILADSIEGDHIVFFPSRPDDVFVFLRGSIYLDLCHIPAGFSNLSIWIDEEGAVERQSSFQFFTPWIDRAKYAIDTKDQTISLERVQQEIEKLTGKNVLFRNVETYANGLFTDLFIPAIKGRFQYHQEVTEDGEYIETVCLFEYDKEFEEVVSGYVEHFNELGFSRR